MKLFLTSAGLKTKKLKESFVSVLPRGPEYCTVLMITYAQTKEEQDYIEESKKELLEIGIKNKRIDFFNLQEEHFTQSQEYDVIYVCGGNTFAILDRLRTIGIGQFITDKVASGQSIYFGVSAGSIIAGPNIEIAGWGAEGDKNDIGLKDLTGFKFVNFSIFPHFKSELEDEVRAYKSRTEYSVIALTDEQAVFMDDQEQKLIYK